MASDCNEAVREILSASTSTTALGKNSLATSSEEKHYRFRLNLWNKILSSKEFERFDENEYFRLLEIYKDERQTRDLISVNPVTIEQKLALIESIQLRLSLPDMPKVQTDIETLNAYQLRKLEKLLKKFDLSKKLTRENLEDFAADFFLILKGPPVSVLELLTKDKTKRMNERLFRVLQEDLLVRGLKGAMERIPEKDFDTQIERAQIYIKRVMKYRAWRIFALPYDLPWIDRIKLSDELIEKILLDGLDAHQSEVIMELKGLNAVDYYERIRKVYRPVAFGVGFYYYYTKFQKKAESRAADEEESDAAKKEFLDEFKKLADAINSGETKIKTDEEIREEQFQRVLKSFKEKYHEDPTPEEYQDMRRKIFGT